MQIGISPSLSSSLRYAVSVGALLAMDIIWCTSCSGKRQSRAETSDPLNEKRCINNVDTPLSCSVGGDGFEPPKASPADLQSAPFGHSGNYPNALFLKASAKVVLFFHSTKFFCNFFLFFFKKVQFSLAFTALIHKKREFSTLHYSFFTLITCLLRCFLDNLLCL